jgi:hypothetical protein
MEETVTKRLRAAANLAEKDAGWSVTVRPTGIRISYTWQAGGNFYTTENITSWIAIERAHANPLLTAMEDLMQQRKEHLTG